MMLSKAPPPPNPALLGRFAAIVGEKYAITDPVAQAPHLVEMRDLYHGSTPMVNDHLVSCYRHATLAKTI